jgi:hypothetical protein
MILLLWEVSGNSFGFFNLLFFFFFLCVGGTSGSVLASRLSENSQYNILVIEAGPW